MPEEVRAEISPWFIEKYAIKEDAPEKISKLDDKAKYMNSDLKVKILLTQVHFSLHRHLEKQNTDNLLFTQPKRSDLDMNHHVNNVKYLRWMLEVLYIQK